MVPPICRCYALNLSTYFKNAGTQRKIPASKTHICDSLSPYVGITQIRFRVKASAYSQPAYASTPLFITILLCVTQILNLLKQNGNKFLSGEYLADTLKVSRTAIWKHIKALRDNGYNIESVPRSGYRLIDSPDLLSSEEIKSSLTTKILGSEILYFETVDSTNTQAKKVALQGVKDGTIIISEEQGGGRGRLSRSFFSPKYKGIWFSVILKTKIFTSRSTKMHIDGCYCSSPKLSKMLLV